MVKSNKVFKILAIMLVAICLISSFSGVVNADAPSVSIEPSQPDGDAITKVETAASNVLWIIQWAGIIAGIIILAYMGIKYITASPDGKAEIKKQAFIYVGGAALLMLAPTIAGWIFGMF